MAGQITVTIEGENIDMNMTLLEGENEAVTTVVVTNLVMRALEHAVGSPLMHMLAAMAKSNAVTQTGLGTMMFPDMLAAMMIEQAEAEAKAKGEQA